MRRLHKDVRFFDILDDKQNCAANFTYLYARVSARRPMDECRVGCVTATVLQSPVAYLTCNFSPAGDKPALFTHDKLSLCFTNSAMVCTTCHQSRCRRRVRIRGVAWDVVELPSQFLENCWEEEALSLFQAILKPESITWRVAKLLKAKNFQSAMQMVRQLESRFLILACMKNSKRTHRSELAR